ncbi:hypothetical protein [Actinomycetospora termitidis]|uniref:Uncharacterized protein n=1 Tax=Actinomycetospora termitidis TaxID=3053470 RepID=A0ABT7MIG5_9PSEU|nr:hypothetical protein [Actinomycetospora sp. Odt1-22]MDL5160441.1 hypothetical protein [Actinomycetospora sp. Odt1-22]
MSSKSSRKRARTRAVRAEMSRTGDNYTRSTARAGDSAHPSPEAGDRSGRTESDGAAQVHVRRLLEALREEVQGRLRYIEELERAGDRIVTGGPKGASNDVWEIHDARTGELIVEGSGGPRGYDAAWKRLSLGTWVERDFIGDDDPDTPLPSETVTTAGIPIGLSHALMEWIENATTPDSEIAAFTGWSVDTVSVCRTDLSEALRAGWLAEPPGAGAPDDGDDNPFLPGTEEHHEHDLYMHMIAARDD